MDFREFLHTTDSCTIGGVVLSCIFDTGFFHMEMITAEPHLHGSYELHCAAAGSCMMEVYNPAAQFLLTPGKILLIPPGCFHNACRTSADYRKFSFCFTPSARPGGDPHGLFTEEALLSLLPGAGGAPLLAEFPEGAGILSVLREELLSRRPGFRELASAELCRFCVRLVRQLSDAVSEEEKESKLDCETLEGKDSAAARQAKMLLYIDRNYQSAISEQTLAESMNLSVRQVSRLFRRYYGQSFCETLTEVRLRHAEKLLERTDCSAEDIAARVGYHAPSAFFCAFRRQYGMTPGEYRKQMRKKEG